MRVRPLLLLGAVVAAAALATWFVVSQMPREGQVSAPRGGVPALVAQEKPTPPLEPPATPEAGTLEVRVTAGGEPQAGADVRLYLAPSAARADGWRRAGEARTDAHGLARPPAGPGVYLVAVRAAGLAPTCVETVRGAGEESRVEIALEPPVGLEGRVVAREGNPIPGARVRLVPVASRWPGFSPPSAPAEEIVAATADAAGAFRVEGLAPGVYALAVEADGFHPALEPRLGAPSDPVTVTLEPLGGIEGVVLLPDGSPAAGARLHATSVDHAATTEAGRDGRFLLSTPAGRYAVHAALGDRAGSAAAGVSVAAGATAGGVEIRLAAGAALEGEVVSARSGRSIAGAEIAVSPHGTRSVEARAVAGPDGRFRIAPLAADAFDVRATAPGASPAIVAGVTLAPGGQFPLRIALPGTGAVEGTVRDLAGRPLAGARVRVVERGDGLAGAGPLEARTAFDGTWRIEGIEIGRAEVVARQEGVALGSSRSVRVREGSASRADFFLPEAGVLAGRVSLEGHAPPAGATVVAVAMKAGLGMLQVARAAVDASGNYRLVLPAGEYRVHAAPAWAARTDLRVAPSFARVVPGRPVRLDLEAARATPERGVEIAVLEPGGAPSPGAVVTLSRPDDDTVAFATTAGEDGRVPLGEEMGMAGRRVTIRARNGGRAGTVTLALPASGTVTVPLAPGGAVEGLVRGPGRAVSGFTVEVSAQPAPSGWRTVDVHRFTGDRFELADLPAEPLRLSVLADDGRRGEAEVRVAAGELRSVVIALEGR